MLGDVGQLGAGLNDHLLAFGLDAAEALDAGQADDLVRLGDVLLLEIDEVGAAGQELAGAPFVVEQADGVGGGLGPVIGEVFHG